MWSVGLSYKIVETERRTDKYNRIYRNFKAYVSIIESGSAGDKLIISYSQQVLHFSKYCKNRAAARRHGRVFLY
jgi:hypothetical protein